MHENSRLTPDQLPPSQLLIVLPSSRSHRGFKCCYKFSNDAAARLFCCPGAWNLMWNGAHWPLPPEKKVLGVGQVLLLGRSARPPSISEAAAPVVEPKPALVGRPDSYHLSFWQSDSSFSVDSRRRAPRRCSSEVVPPGLLAVRLDWLWGQFQNTGCVLRFCETC